MTGKVGRRTQSPGAIAPYNMIMGIERSSDSAAVKEQLIRTAMTFGFSSIFAGWLPSIRPLLDSDQIAARVLLSTMPSLWQARYFERGYVFRDPIVHRLHRESHAPFTWTEAYQSCKFSRDVRVIKGEASEFGLCDGFVAPISMLGGTKLAFSFGASTLDAPPEVLAMLTFLSNVVAGRLLDFATPHVIHSKSSTARVTCRERDCLAWAAEGKTDWEIAAIVGISVPTVRKHFASAREKLNAVNKYHAVAIGMRIGLLR
jgi:LuxR family quorum sensing-dependent transcriptional regulator